MSADDIREKSRKQRLFYNGTFYPLTAPCEPSKEAMLVEGNRIAALGSKEEIFSLAQKEAEKIDLRGGCVLPGFNDSHCHLLHTDRKSVV